MNKNVRKEIDFAGKKLILETGEMALRANMAVKATYGDTVVLVTVVAGQMNPDIDFFPLTVQYEERLYASGSIKSSRFVKRDGRSTDDAIIAKRAIDHAIRPLFPKDFYNEVQVVSTVLSLDKDSDPEFISMTGVAAALQASNIPFTGPMVSARVGMIEDKLVLCPTIEDLEHNSDLQMLVSFVGEDKRFLALEAGANILPEAKILEAVNFARDNLDPVKDLINDFAKELNPEGKKMAYVSRSLPEDQLSAIRAFVGDKVKNLWKEKLTKDEIASKYSQVQDELFAEFEGVYKKVDMEKALYELKNESIRNLVLDENVRIDGRTIDKVRPVSAKVSLLPRTHGSGLFTRGNTQALTIATLGSPSEEILIQDMYGEKSKRYMHYYNFPPYSVGEVGRFGGPKGREIGHGMIAEKGLLPVIPSQKEFPYTIILVSEIISSNGSSSMASTCGSTLALMDAGVPIKDMVAGVAMGLIVRDESFKEYKILTDLSGEEDGGGYLDYKMTGTREGVTAIQVDMKVKGIPIEILPEIIEQSRKGRLHILDVMSETISSPKNEVSDYAPKVVSLKIDPSKIGAVIGSGGKVIKEIQETTNSVISIEEDGSVVCSAVNSADAELAAKAVEVLGGGLKVGDVFEGTVVEILGFGALVEIVPGKAGLLHVSEITNSFVKDVNDYLKVGDKVKVKVLNVGQDGKIGLSKKALEA